MSKQTSNLMALISPPDEPLSSFSQPTSPNMAMPNTKMDNNRGLNFPGHPPLSPQSPAISTFELAAKFRKWPLKYPGEAQVVTNPDPILYPERRQSIDYKPLFEQEIVNSARKLQSPPPFLQRHKLNPIAPKNPSVISSLVSPPTSLNGGLQTQNEKVKEALIDDHYKTRILPNYIPSKSKVTKWSTPKRHLLPTRAQYNLVLDVAWQSMVLKDYNSNPNTYSKRQREENQDNYRINKRNRSILFNAKILKSKNDNSSTSTTIPLTVPRVRKAVKKQIDRSGTPEIKHRRTPVKKTKVSFHFNDIPDYSPRMDTIPLDKNFRVTWNGQPLDLSDDPNKALLHQAELQLASKLRFPCDQYLKTKRRVFVGRVNNLIKHPNKQFCKTDAQQVGGVDVNKLSQLWEAYNSIGWFNAQRFRSHVEKVRDAPQVYDPKNTKWVDYKELFGA